MAVNTGPKVIKIIRVLRRLCAGKTDRGFIARAMAAATVCAVPAARHGDGWNSPTYTKRYHNAWQSMQKQSIYRVMLMHALLRRIHIIVLLNG